MKSFNFRVCYNEAYTQESRQMIKAETTAESFLAVLKALPKSERDAVILRIAQDKEFGRDLVDLAIVAERKDEPSRPFKEYAGRSVVVPIAEWERILEDLEDLDDIHSYDSAMAEPDESVPFDQAVREIRAKSKRTSAVPRDPATPVRVP